MKVGARILNTGQVMKAYRTASKQMDQKLQNRVEAALRIVQREAMRQAPVGKYPSGSGRTGGTLRQSIKYERIAPLTGIVEAKAHYGVYVNYGTYKMRANPFMDRALKLANPIIRKNFKLAVTATLKDMQVK